MGSLIPAEWTTDGMLVNRKIPVRTNGFRARPRHSDKRFGLARANAPCLPWCKPPKTPRGKWQSDYETSAIAACNVYLQLFVIGTFSLFFSASPSLAFGEANRGQGCPTSLSYLSSRLPDYTDPELRELREHILSTDPWAVLQTALDRGFTPQAAAAAYLRRSDFYKQNRVAAEACLRASTAVPAHVISELKKGTFDFANPASGIATNCAKQYVSFYMKALADKTLAVDIACLAR